MHSGRDGGVSDSALGVGAVRVGVTLAGQRIVSQVIHNTRPRGFMAALARHPPADIPLIARRLFALCGTAQSVAAALALRMAGADVDVADDKTIVGELAAERLIEHLRTTIIDWNAVVPLTDQEGKAARSALATARSGRRPDDGPSDALATLGLIGARRAGSWGDRLLVRAARAASGPAETVDPLCAADDVAVLAALCRDGNAFAAEPHLPGRCPQTGPVARTVPRGGSVAGLAGRLAARLGELAAAAAHSSGTQHLDPADWISAGTLAARTGFAAVDTPRGRLHHLVELDTVGRVARYAILAPTEWNFAPGGPFAARLASLQLAAGEERDAIMRLASLYDPCVPCEVDILAGDESASPSHA